MRPGVHATISAPRFNSVICPEIPEPPYTETAAKPIGFAKRLQSLPICVTNSLVGPMIMPMGPSPGASGS